MEERIDGMVGQSYCIPYYLLNAGLRLREMCNYKLLLTRKVLFDMTYVSQS
jgi:hypothetical protein